MRREALAAQTRTEVLLTLRRGESVLLTLGIPVLLLVFLSLADVLPLPDGVDDAVDFLFPGILALAALSSALVGPAIATGFEREYGVLKRLGATPLGRPAIVVAKTIAVLVVQLVQVVVLTGVAVALGWRMPDGAAPGTALAAVLLATVAFTGAGLLLGGTLPGLTTLAAANGLYVVLLLVGGMVFPLDELPGAVQAIARLLPSAALAEILQGSLGTGEVRAQAWAVLAGWAVLLPPLAARCFRWR